MKTMFAKGLGMPLLGVWLILMGLAGFVPAVAALRPVLSMLAVGAGVLILMRR
jgi:hypothetical protein